MEILNSIKSLPNNKSPGSDGLPIEFYNFFWKNINDILFESFQYSFQNKLLSVDQRRSVLTLIPKPEKDTRNLKNWRPISILNSDYKIIAKLLAIRLQNVISKLISSDQVGYIKNRFIGENIRTLLDIIQISSKEENPGMLVLIDFEKAFDTINWNYLFKCLDYFNFGDYFKTWIKILYNEPKSCVVKNNGTFSNFFTITRGIRQGCPISALLFILCVETLANEIRENKDIRGIQISNKMFKINQYADDTCLFLKCTNSLKKALKVFECFYRYAGLRLNKSKTEIIVLGNGNNNRIEPINNISITSKPTRGLGILIDKNVSRIAEINIKRNLKS